MRKLIASLVSLALFAFVPAAHSAVIDYGAYNTDTTSGLDWLDFSETELMNMVDAQAANPGWRLPTHSEIEYLFGQLFDGYYDNQPAGISVSYLDHYGDQAEDIDRFIDLFGAVTYGDRSDAMGFYLDEEGIVRLMGVRRFSNTGPNAGQGNVYGLNHEGSYPDNYDDHAAIWGTYLVRTAVIPIPAAAWLFSSALIGLGWMRRLK